MRSAKVNETSFALMSNFSPAPTSTCKRMLVRAVASVVQSLDSVCLSLSADSSTLSSTNSGYRVVAPSDMHGGPIVFILSYMR